MRISFEKFISIIFIVCFAILMVCAVKSWASRPDIIVVEYEPEVVDECSYIYE